MDLSTHLESFKTSQVTTNSAIWQAVLTMHRATDMQREQWRRCMKKLLREEKDPNLALLSPFPWCGLSPAELLMGRRIRANMPLDFRKTCLSQTGNTWTSFTKGIKSSMTDKRKILIAATGPCHSQYSRRNRSVGYYGKSPDTWTNCDFYNYSSILCCQYTQRRN